MAPKRINTQYDHRKIPILGLVAESASSAPASPVAGQFWLDTSLTPARLKVYENGAWALASQTGTLLTTDRGAANGVASLVSGLVPIAQIPTGQTGTTVPLGDDSRFTNTRTPSTGSVVDASVAAGAAIAESKLALASDAAVGTASRRTIGLGATQAMAGNTRLDTIAAPTGPVSANGQRITNGAVSASATDFVIRSELDASMSGIKGIKDPVRVAISTNVNLASPGATVDGITMVAGDRFLAYGQTTATQNGIYVWNGAAVAATRAPDADQTGEVVDGTLTNVAEGTNQNYQMMQIATPSGAPGAWTQTWQISNLSGTTYTAGNGLTLTGAQFSVNKDTTDATNPVVVSASGVKVGTIPIDHGGTGATTAAGARTALGIIGKYTQTYTTAIVEGTPFTITHSLNTQAVVVSFRNTVTNEQEDFLVIANGVNTITVTSDIAMATPSYEICVIG